MKTRMMNIQESSAQAVLSKEDGFLTIAGIRHALPVPWMVLGSLPGFSQVQFQLVVDSFVSGRSM
jgi:hypothetical protein